VYDGGGGREPKKSGGRAYPVKGMGDLEAEEIIEADKGWSGDWREV
jgi:hypothetical protein